jgi:DNA-damage-inducible protein J
MAIAKDATVKSRINADLKDKVEKVLNSLGMNSSEAIRLFYNQIAMRQEFPLELKVPNQETANALNTPLENKAYDNVDQLFDDVLNEKD